MASSSPDKFDTSSEVLDPGTFGSSIILWVCGWRKRKVKRNGTLLTQWQDPHTGLWYGKRTALKLLKVQLLEQLD